MRNCGKPALAALALVTLIAAPGAGAQGIYKWVDERGRVTYSSTPPPPGRSGKELQVKPGPSPQETEAARQRAESVKQLNEQFADERRKRDAQAATKAENPSRLAPATPAPAERASERDTEGVDYPAYRPPGVTPRPQPLPARPGVGGGGAERPAGPVAAPRSGGS
ncbi:MAG: DUF4124 domain-containing protein [Pseudomonadota bacterium]